MLPCLRGVLTGLAALVLLLPATSVAAQSVALPLCAYLTQDEAAVLAGVPVGAGVSVIGPVSLCGYQSDGDPTATVQLAVTDDPTSASAAELYEIQEIVAGTPLAIADLGERAFWRTNRLLTQLVVLQGSRVITVGVINPQAVPSAADLTPFAARVLAAL